MLDDKATLDSMISIICLLTFTSSKIWCGNITSIVKNRPAQHFGYRGGGGNMVVPPLLKRLVVVVALQGQRAKGVSTKLLKILN